jgi:uncharacterized protein YdcH (DUF465 family)
LEERRKLNEDLIEKLKGGNNKFKIMFSSYNSKRRRKLP